MSNLTLKKNCKTVISVEISVSVFFVCHKSYKNNITFISCHFANVVPLIGSKHVTPYNGTAITEAKSY